MKNRICIFLFLIGLQTNAQSVFGKWKTIDDKTGEAKSIIEIYENAGKVYGKIIDIVDVSKRNFKCEKCTGSDKDKPLIGLHIIKGLTKDGDEYNGGKIIDPESGKIYKSFIKLSGKDKLEVRGYIGFALIGRSQTWVRVK
ncbi:DUF2147 domain-containing protein [Flavobacterium sp.]|uniref:DUF2147 domain-containing protein n=1 Tax=Flavobacterium sp. TaxID=239 RepID=UPI00286DC51A|nr:DUF2147 domain-containing protein [Flavobacterium sp.]